MRVKILQKQNHTDIDLIDLPHEMTKTEIVAHLIATGYGAGNAAVEAAIADLAKKNKVAVPETAAVEAAVETAVAEAEVAPL
jgi:hypothetical protein